MSALILLQRQTAWKHSQERANVSFFLFFLAVSCFFLVFFVVFLVFFGVFRCFSCVLCVFRVVFLLFTKSAWKWKGRKHVIFDDMKMGLYFILFSSCLLLLLFVSASFCASADLFRRHHGRRSSVLSRVSVQPCPRDLVGDEPAERNRCSHPLPRSLPDGKQHSSRQHRYVCCGVCISVCSACIVSAACACVCQ